jgi:predicted SAM-dependent methyltransferase
MYIRKLLLVGRVRTRLLFEQLKAGWQRRDYFIQQDETFMIATYRAYLKRDPDKSVRNSYLGYTGQGSMSRKALLDSIWQSTEFRQLWGLKPLPFGALHHTRTLLIKTQLPPADIILDLGGAANGQPEGALLSLGYPYLPKELIIVDLPVDKRLGNWDPNEPDTLITEEGTRVRYIYGLMADLNMIADNNVDMVFSGESIEHVSEADAEQTIREVWRVLKPGGYFCLDTPNGALTRIESPDKFIHPEHQKEYLVHELVEMVQNVGFIVEDQKAICPMPRSLATKQFMDEEMAENMVLGDNPEEGYLFFLKCRKPA